MSVVFQLRNLMRITSGTSVNATGHIGLTRWEVHNNLWWWWKSKGVKIPKFLQEFITGLSFLPTDETILISTSSSGDGTVRFWVYAAGVELYVMDCNGSVPIHDIVEDSKIYCQSDFSTCSLDTTASLICTCVSKFQGCLCTKLEVIQTMSLLI
jgi:hypothetical protein